MRQLGDRVRFTAFYDLAYGAIIKFVGKDQVVVKDEWGLGCYIINMKDLHEVA